LAKVDPFVIQWPAKWMADDEIRPVVEYLNRFLHDLFIRSGGGDDLIEAVVETTAAEAEASRFLATITALDKRVKDLEESSDTDALIAKVAKLNQKVNKLINELLAAVKANAPNLEQESEKVILLKNLLEETKLLNTRIEEAFETELTKEDL